MCYCPKDCIRSFESTRAICNRDPPWARPWTSLSRFACVKGQVWHWDLPSRAVWRRKCMCGGSISPGSGVLRCLMPLGHSPPRLSQHKFLEVPLAEERLISGRFLRRKPMVVAKVLQRNKTSGVYREENSCPRSQLRRSCRLRACSCDLPLDAGDPGMLMT